MSVSVVKFGPYFSSGSISFSQLRTNFTDDQSGFGQQISASQLRRNTDVTVENPIVPDSTENEQISTGSNLSLSQFRNSIKRYVATQSGTNDNGSYPGEPGFRMGRYDSAGNGIDWSGGGYFGRDGQGGGVTGNLTKNVQKGILITGLCGSTRPDLPGAQMAPIVQVHNVRINVSGTVFGYGGRGGGRGGPDPSGENGTAAINFGNIGYNNRIIVGSGCRIYGGGGGGERGKTGANGANGRCISTRTVGGGCNCPDCPSGWNETRGCYNGWHCGRRSVTRRWSQWWESSGDSKYKDCKLEYTTLGGIGGIGGRGGNGRGYNNQGGSLDGEVGASGTTAENCYRGGGPSPAAQNGFQGETGGRGGDWAENGQNTDNIGNGGSAGRAITKDGGNRYDVYGSVNSNTVKGSIY